MASRTAASTVKRKNKHEKAGRRRKNRLARNINENLRHYLHEFFRTVRQIIRFNLTIVFKLIDYPLHNRFTETRGVSSDNFDRASDHKIGKKSSNLIFYLLVISNVFDRYLISSVNFSA